MKTTVLVTGGAGFMGSHLVDDLLQLGVDVVVIDDLSGGFIDNINENARFIEGSITNEKLIKDIFKEFRFDYVFHLAAYAAEGLSHFIKKFNYENNLIGSINLINAAVNYEIKCFVFTSSIAVYGRNQPPMRENMIPLPEDSYGIAKLAVEDELKICKEMFGLDYVIFRPHNVYGERQNIGDKYRNVVGIFMNQIMQNKPLTIFGTGKQTRAFSYIRDISPIIAKSIFVKEAYNEVFNIGSDEPFTVNDLAKKVCEVMSAEININYLDARNEVTHAYSEHDKVRNVFGYRTTFSLDEGLKNMADWVKGVGSRESQKFKNIEIMKNMPKSWLE